MITEQILAYCAGVVDSDGTIGVKRSTYGMRVIGDCQNPTYSERICVKQVQIEAVDLLAKTFGGCRYVEKPSAKKGRPLYVWQITDAKAAAALRLMLPYLRIKQHQALNCLSLRKSKEISKTERVSVGRGHAGSARRSDDISTEMLRIYENGKALNRLGVR